MAEAEALHGLSCPNCGGMVPIPEGQIIVICPFCDLRLHVRGERGLRRYQTPTRVKRENVPQILKQFLSSKLSIAGDARRKAQLDEVFLAYLPFWMLWAQAMGWVFGQKRVGSGENRRLEEREVKLVEAVTWTGPACDTGEFGVSQIPLNLQALEPFDPEPLHEMGMVFEPMGSPSKAELQAVTNVEKKLVESAKLTKVSQVFVRLIRRRFGLLYYPLWVARYLYRGRAFQLAIDGFSGQVLYGKAPGNTLYRAAVLVFGMALGALVAVDGGSLALYLASALEGDGSEVLIGIALVALGIGFTAMVSAYYAFRYGEQYEYRWGDKPSGHGFDLKEILSGKELDEWLDQLD